MKQWLATQFQQSASLYGAWMAFTRRSPREQVLVVVALICLLVVGMFYGVWRPQVEAFEQAQVRLQQANADYQLLIAKRAELQSPVAQGFDRQDRDANTLRNVVSQTSRKVGLVAERINIEGESRLQVWANDVSYASVAKWLSLLAEERVGIHSLQLERVSAGTVSLRVTLD